MHEWSGGSCRDTCCKLFCHDVFPFLQDAFAEQFVSPTLTKTLQNARLWASCSRNLLCIYVHFIHFKRFGVRSAHRNLAYQNLFRRQFSTFFGYGVRSKWGWVRPFIRDAEEIISPPVVLNYFSTNWDAIHDEWIMGIKWSCGSFVNSTNNRTENINGKLKTIIDRYSRYRCISLYDQSLCSVTGGQPVYKSTI